jgi:hypothetical protein
MGKRQAQIKMGTQNFDVVKVGLKMTSVSSISPTFSHVVSNVIQSHPSIQVFE